MELAAYINTLNKVPVFKSFTNETLLSFFRTLQYQLVRYGKGSIVFLENDKCEALSIVLDGIIQIQKIDSFGKLLTIAEFQSGETLGETLLFGSGNHYPMTAVAKTNAIILKMPKDAVLQLCLQDTIFLTEFLKLLSDKTLTLSGRLKQITLKTIRQKICESIYDEYMNQNQLAIHLQMNRKEWAERLGVQRPSLSRELIKMKEEGIINYERCNIYIKDIALIQKFL
ncbi:MAG: Crp/Fnr family transcriptional regulator [Clostridia bacterium]|jgi:CRP-like cAMP-binding protein|nr:Crp/Fnr family transcriptional regulator [Clostridia bacterium]